MTGHSPNSRGASSTVPLYDLRKNPPYLVDYTSVLSGKRVAATKRRVRFRFGFSNPEALAAGKTGIECRGCEHDVTLVWSHTSGKRLVVADGKEVHFSVGKPTQGKFQFTWQMRGNHTLKFIAHASPPLQAKQPGWKQFDLQLDGMTVFDFPRIFELGTRGVGGRGVTADARAVRDSGGESRAVARRSPSRSSSGGGEASARRGQSGRNESYSNYAMPKEEEMAWARSVETYETRRAVDRLSVLPSQNAPPRESFVAPAAAAPAPDLVSDGLQVHQDLVSAPNALENGEAHDEFAPQAVAPAPAPTYQDVASSIVASYAQPPAPAPAAQVPQAPQPQQQLVVAEQQQQSYYAQAAAPPIAAQPPAQEQAYYAQPPAQEQAYYAQQPAAPPAQEQAYYAQQQPAAPPAQTYEQQPPAPTYQEQQQQAYYQQQAPAPVQTQAYDHQQQQQQAYYQQQQPAVVTPSHSGTGQTFASPDAPVQYNQDPQYDLGASQESPTGVEAIDNKPFNNREVDDVAKSIKNLVNLEDIHAAPEESLENMREAMVTNPFAEKNVPQSKIDKANKNKSPRSAPLPPAGQGYMLAGKSLAEVQAVTSQHKAAPQQEVMKPSAYAGGAGGALVVHGQGAPALHQQQGFGVGASLRGGGYAAQQQQQAPHLQQQYAQQQYS